MPQYIAFLRGINVGGHRIKMDRLRDIFEEMKLKNVSTFIASGNVIFSSRSTNLDSLTTRIERHLGRTLGYDVPTFLRTLPELEAVTAFEPPEVRGADQSTLSVYVTFLRSPASKDLRETFASLHTEMDSFQFAEREFYWIIRGKMSESPLFGSRIEKATRGVPNTARNMKALRRLVAKLHDSRSAS